METGCYHQWRDHFRISIQRQSHTLCCSRSPRIYHTEWPLWVRKKLGHVSLRDREKKTRSYSRVMCPEYRKLSRCLVSKINYSLASFVEKRKFVRLNHKRGILTLIVIIVHGDGHWLLFGYLVCSERRYGWTIFLGHHLRNSSSRYNKKYAK